MHMADRRTKASEHTPQTSSAGPGSLGSNNQSRPTSSPLNPLFFRSVSSADTLMRQTTSTTTNTSACKLIIYTHTRARARNRSNGSLQPGAKGGSDSGPIRVGGQVEVGVVAGDFSDLGVHDGRGPDRVEAELNEEPDAEGALEALQDVVGLDHLQHTTTQLLSPNLNRTAQLLAPRRTAQLLSPKLHNAATTTTKVGLTHLLLKGRVGGVQVAAPDCYPVLVHVRSCQQDPLPKLLLPNHLIHHRAVLQHGQLDHPRFRCRALAALLALIWDRSDQAEASAALEADLLEVCRRLLQSPDVFDDAARPRHSDVWRGFLRPLHHHP
eukprot:3934481-Rhodomonas_salina.4